MTTIEKFDYLYGLMATSGDVRQMKFFGHVMRDMLQHIDNHDEVDAAKYVEWLDAIRWDNYLTECEAEKLFDNMQPEGKWDYDEWVEAMNRHGFPLQESPHYNCYANWIVTNMVYSDSSSTIATLLGSPLQNIPADTMFKACHMLALDKLTDEDSVFNIRSYFSVDC